jgi:hypothetical protein
VVILREATKRRKRKNRQLVATPASNLTFMLKAICRNFCERCRYGCFNNLLVSQGRCRQRERERES